MVAPPFVFGARKEHAVGKRPGVGAAHRELLVVFVERKDYIFFRAVGEAHIVAGAFDAIVGIARRHILCSAVVDEPVVVLVVNAGGDSELAVEIIEGKGICSVGISEAVVGIGVGPAVDASGEVQVGAYREGRIDGIGSVEYDGRAGY